MLTTLKVSSLTCKYIFTGQNKMRREDPIELNFEGLLKVKNKYIPEESDQRVDEKNVVIYLFIMFTPRVMVIKMSKLVHCLHFLLMKAKNQSQFGQNN